MLFLFDNIFQWKSYNQDKDIKKRKPHIKKRKKAAIKQLLGLIEFFLIKIELKIHYHKGNKSHENCSLYYLPKNRNSGF